MSETDFEGVHLLRCPDAIPNRLSLRDQALWADTVGAIWPWHGNWEPTPVSHDQEESLKDLNQLRDAGVFVPEYLDEVDLKFAAQGLKGVAPKEVLQTDDTSWAAACPGLLDSSESDTATTLVSDEEATRFLHCGKLPTQLEDKLVEEGLFERVDAGDAFHTNGLRARSTGLLPWLLTRAAESRASRGALDWTLAPSNPATVAQVARPKPRGKRETAIALGLPALPTVRDDVDVREIIDLRGESSFRSARTEYMQHLRAIQRQIAYELGPSGLSSADEAFIVEFSKRMMAEIQEASRPLWGKHTLRSLAAASIGVAMVMVDVASAITSPGVLTIAGAGLGAASMVAPVITRPHAPELVRMSRTLLISSP